MKKVKYIALVVILMLGLIGGAYAYWTESVVLSGTAETGYMDVNITGVGVGNWNNPNIVPWGTDASGSSSIEADGKSASFHVKGLYPQKYPDDYNVYQNVQIYIKNDSTIPVKLQSVDFTRTGGDWTTWMNMRGIVHLRIYDGPTVAASQIGPVFTGGPDYFSSMNAFMEAWGEWQVWAAANGYDYELEPGWTARFGDLESGEGTGSFIFWLEPGAGNHTQSKEVNFNIKFNWAQYNAQ